MSKVTADSAATSVLRIGAALAMCISWSVSRSILWALLHGFFSWGYVIYYALGYGR